MNMRMLGKMELLNSVLMARHPELLTLIDKIDTLSNEEINRLTNIIGDELMETGLMENSEPNERGMKLEEIIDMLISHLG